MTAQFGTSAKYGHPQGGGKHPTFQLGGGHCTTANS